MTAPGPAGPAAPHPPPGPPAPYGPPPGAPAPYPPAVPAAAPQIPPPPPGPGVVAPFPAPPTEGRTARVWVGLGIGGLAALLCCGAGVTAMGGLVLTGTRAINEQAQVVVGHYLDAVRDGNYREAYRLLCDRAQRDETAAEFAGRAAEEQAIASYDIGDISLTDSDLTVPVTVTYDAGGTGSVRVSLEPDDNTGQFEVCDVER